MNGVSHVGGASGVYIEEVADLARMDDASSVDHVGVGRQAIEEALKRTRIGDRADDGFGVGRNVAHSLRLLLVEYQRAQHAVAFVGARVSREMLHECTAEPSGGAGDNGG